MIYMMVGRWPRSVSAVDKHMIGAEAEEAYSRVGRPRTRAGVCGAGKGGVEGGMSEYMRG